MDQDHKKGYAYADLQSIREVVSVGMILIRSSIPKDDGPLLTSIARRNIVP